MTNSFEQGADLEAMTVTIRRASPAMAPATFVAEITHIPSGVGSEWERLGYQTSIARARLLDVEPSARMTASATCDDHTLLIWFER